MDKQRKTGELSWIDRLIVKNGSLFIGLLAIAVPLYTRFIAMEHRLSELQKTMEKSTTAITALNEALQSEKSTTALLTLRLSLLEKETTQPRLFK